MPRTKLSTSTKKLDKKTQAYSETQLVRKKQLNKIKSIDGQPRKTIANQSLDYDSKLKRASSKQMGFNRCTFLIKLGELDGRPKTHHLAAK